MARKSYEEQIAEHIASIVQDRQIEHVLHFTRLDNLSHILDHGLRARSELATADFDVRPSDEQRMDEDDDAVSVSISCYYPKMFEAKRYRAGDTPWVILCLHPSLLWNLPCRFYAQGVATKATMYEKGSRYGGWALQKLFDDRSNETATEGFRAKFRLPPNCPTFPDAEVQVMRAIDPAFIIGAWIEGHGHGALAEQKFAAAGRGECEVHVHPFHPRIGSNPYFWG
jgi:hypothetical protein